MNLFNIIEHSISHFIYAYLLIYILLLSMEIITPIKKKALVTGVSGQDGSYLS